MKIFISSIFIVSVFSLGGCGGSNDSAAGTVSNIPVKPEHNSPTATQCFEPNIINTNGVRVIDGDTVEVISAFGSSERVRLLGIDAPESKQAYGDKSTTMLLQCVNNAMVTIEWTERDRYDRLLGKVIANKVDCNLNQIQKGAAWHYKEYQSSQTPLDQIEYGNAEILARTNNQGLWAISNPTKPSDYRAGKSKSNFNFNNVLLSSANASRCYSKPSSTSTETPVPTVSKPPITEPTIFANPNEAICTSFIKKTCGEMSSCVEAQQQLACGNTQIDGNKNSIPCEALCQ